MTSSNTSDFTSSTSIFGFWRVLRRARGAAQARRRDHARDT